MNWDRTRYESAKLRRDYLKRVQQTLGDLVDKYYSHLQKAHENFDIGMYRSWEQMAVTAGIGFYRPFENYLRVEFGPIGEQLSTYFSIMVFQNLFSDLLELEFIDENEPTEEDAREAVSDIETILISGLPEQEERMLVRSVIERNTRPSFNRFYYGYESSIYSRRWKLHFDQSFAYRILPHEVGDSWDRETAEIAMQYLAMNLECCIGMIIDTIETGEFDRLIQEFEDGADYAGEALRFSLIYNTTALEMREIDKKLITVDEPTRFNLPEFGI